MTGSSSSLMFLSSFARPFLIAFFEIIFQFQNISNAAATLHPITFSSKTSSISSHLETSISFGNSKIESSGSSNLINFYPYKLELPIYSH